MARNPNAEAGLCNGAKGARRSIARMISLLTSTGAENRSPPWTTRCPAASMVRPPNSSWSRSARISSACVWSLISDVPMFWIRPLVTISSVSTPSVARASGTFSLMAGMEEVYGLAGSSAVVTSRTWYLIDEDPQLTTSTSMMGPFVRPVGGRLW